VNEPMSYVARNSCGCVSGLCVDSPEHRRETARFVAEAVRRGQTIERCTTEDVRSGRVHLRPCEEGPCVRAAQRRPSKQEALL